MFDGHLAQAPTAFSFCFICSCSDCAILHNLSIVSLLIRKPPEGTAQSMPRHESAVFGLPVAFVFYV
jgi:hypothetical protein